MTPLEEKEIISYLISKQLSPALLSEIKDHFISQISEKMKNNIGFQEAFLEAKLSWAKELEMVKADLFSFKRITRIEKEIIQRRFRKMMMVALACSLVMICVFYFNENIYLCLQGGLLILHFGFAFYNFIIKKMKFSEYQRMSFHPLLLKNIVLMLLIIPLTNLISGSEDILWKSPLNHMALTYAFIIQIQLLYFRIKKINVLFV